MSYGRMLRDARVHLHRLLQLISIREIMRGQFTNEMFYKYKEIKKIDDFQIRVACLSSLGPHVA